MLEPSFKRQVVHGFGWQGLRAAAGFAVEFAVGIALARLLVPEDFGLIRLGFIVAGFAALFSTLGTDFALVQRLELSSRHVRVGFTLAVVTGVLLAALVFLFAPAGAQLMGEPRLTPILQWLSLTFLFDGIGATGRALLERRLRFKALFKIQLFGLVFGYAPVGIVLAVTGFGVWSLVFASLAQSFFRVPLYWIASRHSLKPLWSRREGKELLSFGGGMSLAKLFNYFAVQGDNIVVGRMLGAAPLGIYSRAYGVMSLPNKALAQAIGSVLFPAVARVQDEPSVVRNAYLRVSGMLGFLLLPLFAGIAVLPEELVVGVYGEQWRAVGPLLRIFALAGFMRASFSAGTHFLRALGRVRMIVLLQGLYAVSMVAAVGLGVRWYGLAGAACGAAAAIIAVWLRMLFLLNAELGVDWKTLLHRFVGGLTLAVPAGVASLAAKLTGTAFGLGNLATVGFALAAACLLMASMIRVLSPEPVVRELRSAWSTIGPMIPPRLRSMLSRAARTIVRS